MTWGDCIYK